MLKVGLITLGTGVLAVVFSCLMGMGPCGPSSLPGFILLMSGLLGLVAGIGLILAALLRRLFVGSPAR
jgi:hypothetical protein